VGLKLLNTEESRTQLPVTIPVPAATAPSTAGGHSGSGGHLPGHRSTCPERDE